MQERRPAVDQAPVARRARRAAPPARPWPRRSRPAAPAARHVARLEVAGQQDARGAAARRAARRARSRRTPARTRTARRSVMSRATLWRATSSRPGQQRRAHHRLLLAERVGDVQHPARAGRPSATRSRRTASGEMKLNVTTSLRPAPRSRSSIVAPQLLRRATSPPTARAARRQRRGQRCKPVDARDLLDQVGLARRRRSGGSTAPPPRGRRRAARRRSRAARGSPADSVRLDRARRAASRAARCAARSRCGSGSGAATSTVPGTIRAPHSSTISRAARRCACSASAGCSCFSKRLLASVRRPSFFEVLRMLVPFQVAASIATRVVSRDDLAARAAHDPADPGGPVRVADQHGVAVEDALLAVQRREALALARGAHVQRRPGHAVEVVGVHRLAEQQHHVVRDVDDVADRALAGRHQARLQPQRRRARPARPRTPAR